MQTVTPCSIIQTLTKRIKQSLLSLHLHACSVCVCVFLGGFFYASLPQQVFAPGHLECTVMFISKYHRQACWPACRENGITAICSPGSEPSARHGSFCRARFHQLHTRCPTLACEKTLDPRYHGRSSNRKELMVMSWNK